MVHKTVPKIDPEIPFEIVYLFVPEKVPNMPEYSIASYTKSVAPIF